MAQNANTLRASIEGRVCHREATRSDAEHTALIQRPLIWKALAYRVVAIAFTALFTGIKQSLEIHIGLTLIYYLFDLAWERITPRR